MKIKISGIGEEFGNVSMKAKTSEIGEEFGEWIKLLPGEQKAKFDFKCFILMLQIMHFCKGKCW